MATATKYAKHLTETGSRCHLNGPSTRFCHWRAEVLPTESPPPDEPSQEAIVAVRCTIHPGGRYLDANARLAAADLSD